MAVQTIGSWTQVDNSVDYEYRTSWGHLGPYIYYKKLRRKYHLKIWEIALNDGSDFPDEPNPGSLSSPWYCHNCSCTRQRTSPLTWVCRVTWKKDDSWEEYETDSSI